MYVCTLISVMYCIHMFVHLLMLKQVRKYKYSWPPKCFIKYGKQLLKGYLREVLDPKRANFNLYILKTLQSAGLNNYSMHSTRQKRVFSSNNN